MKDLKAAYKTIEADHFAPKMEISFITGEKRKTLSYAIKTKALSRAFETEIPQDVYDALLQEMEAANGTE